MYTCECGIDGWEYRHAYNGGQCVDPGWFDALQASGGAALPTFQTLTLPLSGSELTSGHMTLLNEGEDCYNRCSQQSGRCDNFCGLGGVCCRKYESDEECGSNWECYGRNDYGWGVTTSATHQCVAPMPERLK